jgi:hypothetical protein
MNALNKSSIIFKSTQNEKSDFHFAGKVNDVQSLILVACSYATVTPEKNRGYL